MWESLRERKIKEKFNDKHTCKHSYWVRFDWFKCHVYGFNYVCLFCKHSWVIKAVTTCLLLQLCSLMIKIKPKEWMTSWTYVNNYKYLHPAEYCLIILLDDQEVSTMSGVGRIIPCTLCTISLVIDPKWDLCGVYRGKATSRFVVDNCSQCSGLKNTSDETGTNH